jgi:hypothetical protein
MAEAVGSGKLADAGSPPRRIAGEKRTAETGTWNLEKKNRGPEACVLSCHGLFASASRSPAKLPCLGYRILAGRTEKHSKARLNR